MTSIDPVRNSPLGPGPPHNTHQQAEARNASITTAAELPSRISKRNARDESSTRRTTLTNPIAALHRASGLMHIQATSAGGKAESADGCAQYEVTESVNAHANAAIPPGTRP